MQTILITGPTGNVGMEIIKNLKQMNGGVRVLAGVREVTDSNQVLDKYEVEKVFFDFEDRKSVEEVLGQCETLFLLRPPQLADVEKYFNPLIETAIEKKVGHIVFLSVQGAESSSFIPHHKIEKLIEKSGISYTFLRPAYFMQNFTTTLRKDLVENQMVYLPAGKTKFTLIDVEDLGVVASRILMEPAKHINKAYDLTNQEQLSFGEMAETLSEVLDKRITFSSPNPISFYIKKRRENVPVMFALVMIMLHFLPRFKPTPKTTNHVEDISGAKPKSFREFAISNQELLK